MQVPNVPCGVERKFKVVYHFRVVVVPNVPCGVESQDKFPKDFGYGRFLMYRVELKDMRVLMLSITSSYRFLMYRVELKGER